MSKHSLVLLVLIIILAAFLRLPFLDKYSPGATPDEIQQGYSAYSILKTGRDEWGDFLPIYPRSFGDYRPPLYSYLSVPAVAIFGLNIASVRLPSALFGILSVFVIFFLAKEIFKSEAIGLMAALFLAISNWHVFYSRSAWESNPGAFLFLLGILFFLKGLKNYKFLSLSAFVFGLSLFSYYSFKLLVPLFVFGLVFLYFKQINRIKRPVLILSLAIFLIFLSVSVLGDFVSGGGRRAADAAIYNSENLVAFRNTQLEDKLPQPWGRAINNRLGFLATQFSQNYLGYFSTTFFASPNRPDSTLYNLPGEWLLSVWEVLLIASAVFFLIRKVPDYSKLLILWLLLTPVPGALTRDYLHAQRVETLLFLAPLLTSFGAYLIYNGLKGNLKRKGFAIILGIVVIYSLFYRVDHYLFHTFTHNLGGVHYGYQEIVSYTEANKDKYERIIFTKENSEPQAYVAFFTKWDPVLYQRDAQNWKHFEREGFKFLDMTNYGLGEYYFKNIDWNKDKVVRNTLIVGSDKEIPDGIKPVFQVQDPFGKVLFKVVDTNGQI